MRPSIFNDVIGPVMRGPSSSHGAAALRIGRLAGELMNGAFDEVMVEVKAPDFVTEQAIARLSKAFDICAVKRLSPVLPVLSRRGVQVPFSTCAEMLRRDAGRNTPLWKLAVAYEMARGSLTEAEVLARMGDIVRILRRSIAQGIAGTKYDDRVLGRQSGKFNELMKAGRLLDGGVLNRIVLYVTALMEVKSSMGVIVAAPTAGACAALPGAGRAIHHTDLTGHGTEVGGEESGFLRQWVCLPLTMPASSFNAARSPRHPLTTRIPTKPKTKLCYETRILRSKEDGFETQVPHQSVH